MTLFVDMRRRDISSPDCQSACLEVEAEAYCSKFWIFLLIKSLATLDIALHSFDERGREIQRSATTTSVQFCHSIGSVCLPIHRSLTYNVFKYTVSSPPFTSHSHSDLCSEPLLDCLPIDNVPNGLEILRLAVLVLQTTVISKTSILHQGKETH